LEAGEQQRFGFGIFFLCEQAAAQQALRIECEPIVRKLFLANFQAFAKQWLGFGGLILAALEFRLGDPGERSFSVPGSFRGRKRLAINCPGISRERRIDREDEPTPLKMNRGAALPLPICPFFHGAGGPAKELYTSRGQT